MTKAMACGLAAVLALAAHAAAQPNPLPADWKDKIASALPAKAHAVVERSRKLLVFTLTRGFRHSSIPVGVEALTQLGRKSGAFDVVHSEDIAMFERDKLAQFDAVCFLNTTGELFEGAPADADAKSRQQRLQQNLLEFVRNGGGFVGIHSATDTCYQWPDYGLMIGGYFDGHPWHEPVVIMNAHPDHPLNSMFEAKDLKITDEIYQLKAPYDGKRQMALLRLATEMVDMTKPGINRKDDDFGVSWIRAEGRGRVFYCSLGHREEVYWNPKVLSHYLAGLQWALGDLKLSGRMAPNGSDWRTLFDGKTLAGWSGKAGAWKVEDGCIARAAGGDFLWSDEQFGDFELQLQFKISEKGNSGVFIRTGDKVEWLHTGMEVQVLDSFGKAEWGKHDCGALYDCAAPRVNAVRAPGEWNDLAVRCVGSRVQVTMNGQEIVDVNLDDWTTPGRNPDGTPNKFRTAYKDMPRRGFIGLQDHGNPVWYREIRVREIGTGR